MSRLDNCTSITPACPIEATTYGYYPDFGPNLALLIAFGVFCLLQITMGILTRVYSYSIIIALGCFVEALGYGGRLVMHNNPWSDVGMRLQIICLIIAPSFLAGGIFFTIKNVTLFYGPQFSRLRPRLYTWIFIGCDIGSIFLQAIGGGVAASAGKTNKSLLDTGDGIIIAGIAFQIVTMVICGVLVIDYSIRKLRGTHAYGQIHTSSELKKARVFVSAVTFAYLTVLIRCIYRLPEMAGGWGNPRMRDEEPFLILDGLMIALASAALTVVHPGFFFSPMKTRQGKEESLELRAPLAPGAH